MDAPSGRKLECSLVSAVRVRGHQLYTENTAVRLISEQIQLVSYL
jgi:hypothetical protein